MRVVDPKLAYSMLHREHAQPLAPQTIASAVPMQQQQQQPFQGHPSQFNVPPPSLQSQFNMPPPGGMPGQFHNFAPPSMGMGQPQSMHAAFPGQQPPQNTPMQMVQQFSLLLLASIFTSKVMPQPQQQIVRPQNSDNLDEEQQAQMLVWKLTLCIYQNC